MSYESEKMSQLRKAKRSLGLRDCDILPRCGHKLRNKIRKFEESGDFSHSDEKHRCPECTCQRTAGFGTKSGSKIGKHLGVGWCYLHEKKHADRVCRVRATKQRDAIRAGYPMNALENLNPKELQTRIESEASEANELISLRENQKTIVDLGNQILECINGGVLKRPKLDNDNEQVTNADGDIVYEIKKLTESSATGNHEASDVTLFEMYRKFSETNGKLAKIALEITDNEYVHVDEAKVFFSELVRIAMNIFDVDKGEEFLNQIRKLRQPSAGKKKKR